MSIEAQPARPAERAGYRPGYEIAAERLLEYVTQQNMRPGERLPTEQQLSEILQVSRTVAREAVKMLSALGRLSVRKGAGIFVGATPGPAALSPVETFLPADLDHVDMLFEYRQMLETEAARFAAQRATPPQVRAIREAVEDGLATAASGDPKAFHRCDERFHSAVAQAANNIFLTSAAHEVITLKHQVVTLGLRGAASGSLTAAARMHEQIGTAIASGDSDAAGAAAGEHVASARRAFREQIRYQLSLQDRG